MTDQAATKADIVTLDAVTSPFGLRDLTIRTGGMPVIAVGILLGFKFF
jgi:hypothetical protein